MSDGNDNGRTGKIARCPLHIREEVNRRLLDGQSGPVILRWLNAQAEVLEVLDLYFGEEPVKPQNLSEWRQGGFQDYKKRLEQIERTKAMSDYAAKLADGNRGAAGGNAAIVGGQLLEIFESLDLQAQKDLLRDKPGTYILLLDKLAKIDKSQADRIKAEAGRDMVEIQKQRADQAEAKLKLEREKHEVKTCEAFIKFYTDKRAKEIVEGKGSKPVKVEGLRQLMFPMDEPLNPKPLNG